jgi:thiamine-phosphate pyrophosphorylase
VTDATVLALPDFPVRAAALAAAGSAVALHARDRSAGGARLAEVTERLLALARPPEAAVFVNARPDVAAALGAHGVQLGQGDLAPRDVRAAFGDGWHPWIGVSVHSAEEARAAAGAGADYVMVGTVYHTTTHPDRPAGGLALVEAAVKAGVPVIAVGGITPERAHAVRAAGAYGVAAITAAWRADDPAAAALQLLAPWADET